MYVRLNRLFRHTHVVQLPDPVFEQTMRKTGLMLFRLYRIDSMKFISMTLDFQCNSLPTKYCAKFSVRNLKLATHVLYAAGYLARR